MKFTSVVGYHMNPLTCGVAKFNAELARRLGVPYVSLFDEGKMAAFPLLSLKWSEMNEWPGLNRWRNYGLFWHDAGQPEITQKADIVFYADPSLGPNGLWCPSLIAPTTRRMVRLFSFGMAHKLQTSQYVRVRELLDTAGFRYHLRVSVGLHEGTSLDDATKHFGALKDILGEENVTILGILSDDAVSEELHQADYVLAFFEQGVRANNTTVHAALDAGCRVITNHDDRTPAPFRMATLDIAQLTAWPARNRTPVATYSWDNLLREMERICAHSKSAIAS